MKKWVIRGVALVVLLAVAAVFLGFWIVGRQGVSAREWASFSGAKVRFDEHGIPTIEAETWPKVIEAQGYVLAADRLFQMDMMRRAASGRLAELFGESALAIDEKRLLEDWDGAVARNYETLAPDEKEIIDVYTVGVNRFIKDHADRWGIEYQIIGTQPEPWTGKDCLSILMLMAEQLTAFSNLEAGYQHYAKAVGPAWASFIFPEDHPWNEPMFDVRADVPHGYAVHTSTSGTHRGPVLPMAQALPLKPIDGAELTAMHASLEGSGGSSGGAIQEGIGSNNWAWCGKTGCFLANDPHLGESVPSIWYASRLRLSAEDWMVGVTVPGIPGIALGMNSHLAWAFTNVGEDVDDFLLEKVDADEKNYLAAIEDGKEVWKPIIRAEKTIKIKGKAPKTVTYMATHRGPLARRPSLDNGWYSRQWLALKDGFLRFPTDINRAKNWDEMMAAVDKMRIPAQNMLVVDRAQGVGYRASGTGIVRRVDGSKPQPAIEGEWIGFKPYDTRPRIHLDPSDKPRFLATANERIWTDTYGHRWSEDLRKDRIRRVLSSREDLSRADMEHLQLDTESRYARMILDWTKDHAEPKGGAAKDVLARWARWDGTAKGDPETFTDATEMDRALTQLAIGRLKQKYLPPEAQNAEYSHWMRSAWVITVLGTKGGVRVFGFDEKDLADHLLQVAVDRAKEKAPPYFKKNRWAAQHPFATRLPVIGGLFAVDTPYQYGWRGLVRVEQPNFGASVRLVWDLVRPSESTWSLPVGQSGHIGSPHFRDLQKDWFREKPYKVLDDSFEWK